MSGTREDLLEILKDAKNQEELLWKVTRMKLASLNPAIEEAAYHSAILRWFNPEILEAVLSSGRLRHTGRHGTMPDSVDVQEVCDRLQSLSFIEVSSEHGYRFHDNTREVVLAYLWQEENEFYLQVSARAAEFFIRNLETEAGTPFEDILEWVYYLIISDEPMAVAEIDNLIASLSDQSLGGYCDALLQSIREHARAERLSSMTLTRLRYWEVIAAYLNNRYDKVLQIAADLLSSEDEFVSLPDKARVRVYVADTLRLTGRFGDAEAAYQELLEQLEEIEPMPELKREAFLGLGRIARGQGNLNRAEEYYRQALEVEARALMIVSYYDEEGDIVQFIGLPNDEALPSELRLYDPESWWSNADLLLSKTIESDETDPVQESESFVEPELPIFLVEVQEISADGSEEFDPSEFITLVVDIRLAEIWLNLADIYLAQFLYDRAAASARLAGILYRDLDNARGLQQAFQLLYSLGVTTVDPDLMKISAESQQQLLQYAIEQSDSVAEQGAQIGLAIIYWNQSDFELARESLEEALRLARDLEDKNSIAVALEYLAELDLNDGLVESAESGALQALALYREIGHGEGEARLLNTMGHIALQRRQADSAAEYHRAALDLFERLQVTDGQIDSYMGLAAAARLMRDYTDARINLEEALSLARKRQIPSKEIEVLSGLAQLRFSQNQLEAARTMYEKALSVAERTGQGDSKASLLLSLGNVAVAQEKYQEAIELYDAAEAVYIQLNQPAGSLDVLFGRVYMYEVQQDGEQMVRVAEQALALANRLQNRPNATQAVMAIYDGQKLLGNYDLLLGILDSALTQDPDSIDVLTARVEILSDFAQYEEAAATSDKLIKIDPKNSTAFQMMGWALSNMGKARARECLTAYETAVFHDDQSDWAHKGVAEAYLLLGEFRLANEKFRWLVNRLLAQKEPSKDRDLLAWCYFRLGEYQNAVDGYEQVMERTEDRLFNQFDYAMSLLANGEYQRGLQEYRLGIELVTQRQPLIRRGFLNVAIDDLRELLAMQSALAETEEAQSAIREMQDAWQEAQGRPQS